MNGNIERPAKRFEAQWRINAHIDAIDVQTVDLILNYESSHDESIPGFRTVPDSSLQELLFSSETQPAISSFFQRAQELLRHETQTGIKFILPACDGHVSRSDMIEFRFFGCELVELASGFVKPLQHVRAFRSVKDHDTENHFRAILDSAVGAVVVKQPPDKQVNLALEALELEIKNRLSIKWLLPEPISEKRVAMVCCLPEWISFEVLPALGIKLVILDKAGHEAQDDNGPFARFREFFCPCDLNPDAGLPQRIVDALHGIHVDGIYTHYDAYHTKTAQAAEVMGLPTSPLAAFAIATDKYASRMLQADKNSAVCVADAQELQHMIQSTDKPLTIDYPVVVKPCMGRASWSVVKAETEAETLAAVDKAHSRVIGYEDGKPIQSLIMVEPYVDGPEVDVNFALLDGEVLFFDVSDNFPCAGDLPGTSSQHDFQETMFVSPSILPQPEQDLLASSLRDSLLRMGFRTGIFHCEGRVRNSSMRYTVSGDTIDLETKAVPPSSEPSVFMLEVNPREPGYIGRIAVTWTFGVDYYAMYLFRCIGDWQRYRASASPFVNGAQYTSALVLIMPEKGGILTSPDPAIELRKSRPDLMDSIPLYRNVFEKGQRVTPPDAVDMVFMSTIIVKTTKGRKDLLHKADKIRKNWHVTIE
ncbi:MAG: hypothetical protein Q9201_002594 [Fulgogasparrea decipioides]